MERVTRSPRLAAMGVAMLSGFIPRQREPTITDIMSRPSAALATLAVTSAAAGRMRAWRRQKVPSVTQSSKRAKADALAPTTSAWPCQTVRKFSTGLRSISAHTCVCA